MQASTSNGYAKYQIRSSGIGRVLAEESTVFTIEDHEEGEGNTQPDENEKSRLVDCPLDSDEEADDEDPRTNGMTTKGPRSPLRPELLADDRNRAGKPQQRGGSEKELSRLTDEFDVEGDSASDELDLLPPLGAPPHNASKLWKFFGCCRSRVPMKCTIL
ncbi:unnamed protein product, partial [Mesorhabditis spiculigera]